MHIRALLLYFVLSFWVTSAFAVPIACDPVAMTASNGTSGDLLVDGTPGCVADIYSCNTAPATFLGTYTLDGSGSVNTGISTTIGDCYSANATGSNNVLGDFKIPDLQTACSSIGMATIGGSANVPLSGGDGALSYSTTYNGVTYTGLPAGDFSVNNIVGDAQSLVIRAVGVDGAGNEIYDERTCSLDYVMPTCSSASQNPDSTVTPVDVGTVISLGLNTTSAIAAAINGTPMTPSVDPSSNTMVNWSATHTAVQDTTINATVTNPDGETASCSWPIDINCQDAMIISVANPGSVGVTISGSPGCDYLVRTTTPDSSVTDYQVTVGPGGTGTLSIVIPVNTLIEVSQNGFFIATDSFMTPCEVPGIVSAVAYLSEIVISGSSSCEYLVRVTPPAVDANRSPKVGSSSASMASEETVVVGPNGLGTLITPFVGGALIEVGQNMLPFVATDSLLTQPPIPIPALSWWSLLLMAALLALGGILTSVRNKTRRSNVSAQKT